MFEMRHDSLIDEGLEHVKRDYAVEAERMRACTC
jgi:hypothetical protein